MNEVIGAKGGSNDRRRSLVIRQNLLKKLKQHRIRMLEKQVRKIQIKTFFTTVSLLIPYSFLNTIFKNSKKIKDNKKITIYDKKPNIKNTEENKEIEVEIIKPKKIISFLKEKKIEVRLKPKKDKNKESNEIKKDKNNEKEEIKQKNSEVVPEIKKDNVNKINIVPIIPIISINKKKEQDKENDFEDKKTSSKTEEDINTTFIINDIAVEVENLLEEENKEVEEDSIYNPISEVNKVLNELDDISFLIKDCSRDEVDYYYRLLDRNISSLTKLEIPKDLDIYLYEKLNNKIDKVYDKKKELETALYNKDNNKVIKNNISDDKYFKLKEKVKKIEKEKEKIIKKIDKKIRQKKIPAIIKKIIYLNTLALSLLYVSKTSNKKRKKINKRASLITTYLVASKMNSIVRQKENNDNYMNVVEQNIEGISSTMELIDATNNEIDSLINNIYINYKDYLQYDETKNLVNSLKTVKNDILQKQKELVNIKNKKKIKK